MLEVELKLQVKKLPKMAGLECTGKKRVVDYYYDTPDYKLLVGGNFLRDRNNKKIDFKLDVGDLSHTFCKETSFKYDNFAPNEDIIAIFNGLGIELATNFANFKEFVKANNLKTLAVIDKIRREYKYQDLTISLDNAKRIGKFMEIEYCVPDDTKVDKDEATKYILDKMQAAGLLPKDYTKVDIGYVELYLKKHNPAAYIIGLYK